MAAEEHDGGRSPSVDPRRVDHSLDELARGLASGTVSRGKAIRWMGSALVGAALASVPGVAWAACPEGQTRCGDRCVNLQTNERHCGSCSNRCRSTQTCCKGRCVNLQRNERHCGSCSNHCPEGSECVGGVCQCPTGTTLCGGNCVTNCPSGRTLNANCECECTSGRTLCDDGFCTPNCPSGLTLNTSTCQCEGECPTGQVLCTLQGVCVSNTCPPNQTYDPYFCECECPEGDETCCPDCGGRCCPSPGCFCAVRVDNGSRFCYSGGQSVISCAECGIGEVCVYAGGRPRLDLACVFRC